MIFCIQSSSPKRRPGPDSFFRKLLCGTLAALIAVAACRPSATAREPGEDPRGSSTELDQYVATPDDSFAWQIVERQSDDQATTLLVDLTSQTWRSSDEVDRTRWKHWLWIIVPKDASSDTGVLLIGGGSNGGDRPQAPRGLMREVALGTKTVVAEVSNIPNQPLEFFADGRKRKEDDLLARSWRAAVESGDHTWPGQLPMTKAAVKAMDAVQAVLVADNELPDVERFVVAGGSKRGWTTWLTAAVDKRVAAIAPIVIDMLNIRESMRHHHEAYGFWAPAIGDYERAGLLEKLDDPRLAPLLDIVDPYVYRKRMTMPKCIINASGDQFFTPDSSQFYFDDLPGEKLLSYVPNAGHGLDGSNAVETLSAFVATVAYGLQRPQVSWQAIDGGGWQVACNPPPQRALLWQAVNPAARDFRFDQIGAAFSSAELQAAADGRFEAKITRPAKGFTAMFVQLECNVGAPVPLRVTTPVCIVAAEDERQASSGVRVAPEHSRFTRR